MKCIALRFAVVAVFCASVFRATALLAETPPTPFRIEVIDKESRWPVPMVELKTTNEVKFVTDNAGRVAFDLPELMGQETWLGVTSDGYEAPADGFGLRGVRVTPQPGKTHTIEVNRTSIAKRLGRVTGAGLFAESQKLGLERDWKESGIVGCDSVQNAVHNGRMFWSWGDTSLARYPLGIFDVSSATTAIEPLTKFEPPLKINFEYFKDKDGKPRGVAKMPGPGPTWCIGYLSLPDKTGKERLVSAYLKVKPPMECYETGLCVWNDDTNSFDKVRTVWSKSDADPKEPPMTNGHGVIFDDGKQKWALYGNPLPTIKCPATFEAWQDPETWETLKPQETLKAAGTKTPVKPASGSIAWNAYRKRWVTIFVEEYGKPSWLGEVWYAEADSPLGPWGPAVKVLSHANYAYYNPQMHPEFTPANSPILLFEGTHSQTFANNPQPTPRYDYNQIMYRVDLDDPKLAPAQKPTADGR